MKLAHPLTLALSLLAPSAGCTLIAGLGSDFTLAASGEGGIPGTDGGPPLDGTIGDVTPIDLPDVPVPPVSGNGRVLYNVSSTYFLVEARSGATAASVTAALDAVSPGRDSRMNMGADGSLVVETTRLGCSEACLAIFAPDLRSGERVLPEGRPVVDMRDVVPAVAGNGALVVFGGRGPHPRDLFVSARTNGVWSKAALLTEGSNQPNNFKPSIAPDGSRVIFDCGADPFGSNATGICEVNVNGTGFRRVIGPEGGPGGGKNTHSPGYARDGTIVFEGEWGAEQIWRIPPGGAPSPVNGSFSNDNTPCVLPNGNIVSLWLQRPGNTANNHELKMMNADGSGMVMLTQGFDINDIGLGCGN